ncbi:hypothetical protein HK102_000319 [Quaeritorhiza haematococci]|nr:hypothetical protein HK102_000319 [Quaeritorhiza haematococci]
MDIDSTRDVEEEAASPGTDTSARRRSARVEKLKKQGSGASTSSTSSAGSSGGGASRGRKRGASSRAAGDEGGGSAPASKRAKRQSSGNAGRKGASRRSSTRGAPVGEDDEDGDRQEEAVSDEEVENNEEEPSQESEQSQDEESEGDEATPRPAKSKSTPKSASARGGRGGRRATQSTRKGKGKADEDATGAVAASASNRGRPKAATRGRPKKKDAGPSAKAPEEDTSLFAIIRNHGNALESTVSEWVETYQEDRTEAMFELVNLIIESTGSTGKLVDRDVFEDPDLIQEILEELQTQFPENQQEYPLIEKHRGKGPSKFRKNFNEFWTKWMTKIRHNILFEENAWCIETVKTWLVIMSSSLVRAFRHTATTLGLILLTGLCEIAQQVHTDWTTTNRQLEAEQKKGSSRSSKSQRHAQLEQKASDLHSKKMKLETQMNDLFDGDPGIRMECIRELGVWITKFPDVYLDPQYLRYLGWMLYDKNPLVRLEALSSLQRLYTNESMISGLRQFTERFKPRLIELACMEKESSVRHVGVAVITRIASTGLLEDEDRDSLMPLIFSEDPQIRQLIGKYAAEVWLEEYAEPKRDELKARGGAWSSSASSISVDSGGPSAREAAEKWIDFKALAAMLVNYATLLDKQQNQSDGRDKASAHDSQFSIQSQSSSSQSQSQSLGQQSEALLQELEDEEDDMSEEERREVAKRARERRQLVDWFSAQEGIPGSFTVGYQKVRAAVWALWDGIEPMQDWKTLCEYLAQDFSTLDEPSQSLGAPSNESFTRGCTLTDEEELCLVYVLGAVINKVLIDAGVASSDDALDGAAKAKKSSSASASAALAEDTNLEVSRGLMKYVPKLLKKYSGEFSGNGQNRLVEVVGLVRCVDVGVYLELRMLKAYDSLFDDLKKLFMKHANQEVLAECCRTFHYLMGGGSTRTTDSKDGSDPSSTKSGVKHGKMKKAPAKKRGRPRTKKADDEDDADGDDDAEEEDDQDADESNQSARAITSATSLNVTTTQRIEELVEEILTSQVATHLVELKQALNGSEDDEEQHQDVEDIVDLDVFVALRNAMSRLSRLSGIMDLAVIGDIKSLRTFSSDDSSREKVSEEGEGSGSCSVDGAASEKVDVKSGDEPQEWHGVFELMDSVMGAALTVIALVSASSRPSSPSKGKGGTMMDADEDEDSLRSRFSLGTIVGGTIDVISTTAYRVMEETMQVMSRDVCYELKKAYQAAMGVIARQRKEGEQQQDKQQGQDGNDVEVPDVLGENADEEANRGQEKGKAKAVDSKGKGKATDANDPIEAEKEQGGESPKVNSAKSVESVTKECHALLRSFRVKSDRLIKIAEAIVTDEEDEEEESQHEDDEGDSTKVKFQLGIKMTTVTILTDLYLIINGDASVVLPNLARTPPEDVQLATVKLIHRVIDLLCFVDPSATRSRFGGEQVMGESSLSSSLSLSLGTMTKPTGSAARRTPALLKRGISRSGVVRGMFTPDVEIEVRHSILALIADVCKLTQFDVFDISTAVVPLAYMGIKSQHLAPSAIAGTSETDTTAAAGGKSGPAATTSSNGGSMTMAAMTGRGLNRPYVDIFSTGNVLNGLSEHVGKELIVKKFQDAVGAVSEIVAPGNAKKKDVKAPAKRGRPKKKKASEVDENGEEEEGDGGNEDDEDDEKQHAEVKGKKTEHEQRVALRAALKELKIVVDGVSVLIEDSLIKSLEFYFSRRIYSLEPALDLTKFIIQNLKNWLMTLVSTTSVRATHQVVKTALLELLRGGVECMVERVLVPWKVKYGGGSYRKRRGDGARRESDASSMFADDDDEEEMGDGSGDLEGITETRRVLLKELGDVNLGWRVWGALGGVVQQILQGLDDGVGGKNKPQQPGDVDDIENVGDIVDYVGRLLATRGFKPSESDPLWEDYWAFVKALEKGDSTTRKKGLHQVGALAAGAKSRRKSSLVAAGATPRGQKGRRKSRLSKEIIADDDDDEDEEDEDEDAEGGSQKKKGAGRRKSVATKTAKSAAAPGKKRRGRPPKNAKKEGDGGENDEDEDEPDVDAEPTPTRRSARVADKKKSYREKEEEENDEEDEEDEEEDEPTPTKARVSAAAARKAKGGQQGKEKAPAKSRKAVAPVEDDEEEAEEDEEEDEEPVVESPKSNGRGRGRRQPMAKAGTKGNPKAQTKAGSQGRRGQESDGDDGESETGREETDEEEGPSTLISVAGNTTASSLTMTSRAATTLSMSSSSSSLGADDVAAIAAATSTPTRARSVAGVKRGRGQQGGRRLLADTQSSGGEGEEREESEADDRDEVESQDGFVSSPEMGRSKRIRI